MTGHILSTPIRRIVWVVDDSPLDAERARLVLAREHDVTVFRDGSAALERVAAGVIPDVLVLDWMMPGVSGPEVCRFLRMSAPGARIGILLLTAHRDTAEIVEGFEAGANDFLSKPWVEPELRARVAALVRNHELLERVERAEKRTQNALATSPDPLFALDATGRVSFANDEAARAVGRAAADLSGKRIGEVLPGIDVDVARAADASRVLHDVTLGDRVFAPIARLLDDEGPAHAVVALRDVTDRRRAETRRLDFYSIVAHDLRSPLGAVLMRTELLARGRHGPLSAAALADIQKIDKGLKSLVALINDFLDFTRLEGGGYKLERDEVDLAAVVADVMSDVEPLVAASGLSWRAEPSAPAHVLADKRRIVQVVTNLASNAIKFTPRGGTITTRIAPAGASVEVSVEDTGCGIPPEIVHHIFERYTRSSATEHEVQGTGLGLMIVREIVEAHGGQVGVSSDLGTGTRFWFRLPRAASGGRA